ncbi:2-polyprenyl-6-methoxyphenol hydroxylase-like FAD-dependent oxidoreductase [Crossiella equi]|uniref:2-polyprenyl-6-methoxyphenol hydroxylase-like FAD-dependent oxidoreductase n=1 Tax=Crossiella equi TaxID=130796 RepID=A0ABS5ANC8_9PSEU|nr:FAD-dependent monooxygenase [Crossiella equi]MBP2477897.1 2-polyprenyl-6-methoxyphenol hydroxylase-like FAD-dependent oxidoreductase [Crossiella equi]
METTKNNGRVLVVGLGISGIATALRLRRDGWTPVLLERAPARRSGGYFVGLFGAGKAAARRLGILDGMADRTDREGANYDIDRLGNRRRGLGFKDLPGLPRLMLRGDVEQAAFDQLPEDVEIRYHTVPTAISQDADGVDVTTLDTETGQERTERYDLLVGADGLRSTVRRLAFGPHERYLHRLNHMIAAFELPGSLSDLAQGDGATLLEPGRSLWIFPFKDHAPTAMLSWRTGDVDAEFTQTPVERVRAAFGPQAPGRALREVIAAMENTDEVLFDSVEQVRMERWHTGRVVLVGDSAWCVTLYAGMGVSAGLAGADLLGTMLARHPGDLPRALREWEAKLRPYVEYYQRNGIDQREFFTPGSRFKIALRRALISVKDVPGISQLLAGMREGGKASRMKEADIAAA